MGNVAKMGKDPICHSRHLACAGDIFLMPNNALQSDGPRPAAEHGRWVALADVGVVW
jgi:hypothetical protein